MSFWFSTCRTLSQLSSLLSQGSQASIMTDSLSKKDTELYWRARNPFCTFDFLWRKKEWEKVVVVMPAGKWKCVCWFNLKQFWGGNWLYEARLLIPLGLKPIFSIFFNEELWNKSLLEINSPRLQQNKRKAEKIQIKRKRDGWQKMIAATVQPAGRQGEEPDGAFSRWKPVCRRRSWHGWPGCCFWLISCKCIAMQG